MKSLKLLVAAGLAAAAFGAHAADTNTLTINGTITGTCKFNAAAETLAMTLDPTSAANAVGTQNIQYWCTTGTTPVLAAGNGNNFAAGSNNLKQAAAPNAAIPYTIAVAGGGNGAGKSTLLTAVATVTILNANYINADATSVYTDQVVITLTP
jgi:hypothetical protein